MSSRLEKIALTKYKEFMGRLSEKSVNRLTEVVTPKKKLTSGELKAVPERAVPYKIHDYKKHQEGLERGNTALAEKYNIDFGKMTSEEFADKAFSSFKQYPGWVDDIKRQGLDLNTPSAVADLKNILATAHRNSAGYISGFLGSPKSKLPASRGSVEEFERVFSIPFSKDPSERAYLGSILARHEINEITNAKRILKNNKLTYKHEHADYTYPATVYTSHVSPRVLLEESANVAVAPKNVREALESLRGRSLESYNLSELSKELPNQPRKEFIYGQSGKLDKKLSKKMEHRLAEKTKT